MKKILFLVGLLFLACGFEVKTCQAAKGKKKKGPMSMVVLKAPCASRLSGSAPTASGQSEGQDLGFSAFGQPETKLKDNIWSGFQATAFKDWGLFIKGGGAFALCGALIYAVLAKPTINILTSSITGAFHDKISLAFKKTFGGINFEITSISSNCQEFFLHLERLIRQTQAYANREVGRAMNVRNKSSDAVVEPEEALVGLTEEADSYKKIDTVCQVCKKGGDHFEYYFDCRKTLHGIHAKCAENWFKKSPEQSLHCPQCKAMRKFDIMQKDAFVTNMIDRLGVGGTTSGLIITIRATQKRIAHLIRKLDLQKKDFNALHKQKLLASIYQDLQQIYEILATQQNYKEFCNQATLEELSIYAIMGQNNCLVLNNLISGTSGDSIGRRAGGNPYVGGYAGGGGLGGLGGMNYGAM